MTARAEERAPSADPDPADRGGAPDAFLPFPAVNPVDLLEIPGLAVGIRVVADGRAFPGDGLPEDRPHGLPQRPGSVLPQRRPGAQGMDSRPEKHFVGVDVADPGDRLLVEEQGLHGAAPRFHEARERGEAGLERLGAEGFDLGSGRGRPRAAHEPEFPDIVEMKLDPPARKGDYEAGMLGRSAPRPGKQELSGHLQMENEGPAAFAADERELAAAPEGRDSLPFEFPEGAYGGPPQEGREEDPDAPDFRPDEAWLEGPDDRFDFGQFGHGVIVQEGPAKQNSLDSRGLFDYDGFSYEDQGFRLHGSRLARPRPGARRPEKVRQGGDLLHLDLRHDRARASHGGEDLSLPDGEPADDPGLFRRHRERGLLPAGPDSVHRPRRPREDDVRVRNRLHRGRGPHELPGRPGRV